MRTGSAVSLGLIAGIAVSAAFVLSSPPEALTCETTVYYQGKQIIPSKSHLGFGRIVEIQKKATFTGHGAFTATGFKCVVYLATKESM